MIAVETYKETEKMKSPTAKAFVISAVILAIFYVCLFIGLDMALGKGVSFIKIFTKTHGAQLLINVLQLIVFPYVLLAALFEWGFKRKAKQERDEQDRLEQKETQAKMNKVLDMQMAEFERKQKELEERERKLNEQEKYMPK